MYVLKISAIYAILKMNTTYGVAATSRLLKRIGLFCKRDLQKRRYSAKETCNFKEPTNRSYPIPHFPGKRALHFIKTALHSDP